ERELEELTRLWQAGAQGHGNVAVLVGEAGIGKSRLTEALSQRIAGERHIRLRIQCSPYHTNSALWPFTHQLEREADFRRGDSAAEKLDKLEALLSGSTDHVAEVAPLFAALLSVPAARRYPALQMTPQQQKTKTINALLDRLGGLA